MELTVLAPPPLTALMLAANVGFVLIKLRKPFLTRL